jgi:hypothetical protein
MGDTLIDLISDFELRIEDYAGMYIHTKQSTPPPCGVTVYTVDSCFYLYVSADDGRTFIMKMKLETPKENYDAEVHVVDYILTSSEAAVFYLWIHFGLVKKV